MRSRLALCRSIVAVGCLAALGLASIVASPRTAASMAAAAEQFLASLTPDLRQQAALSFDSEERVRFHYIPTEMFPRKGLAIAEMNEAQREAAHELLEKGLSQLGYTAAIDIMQLEMVLGLLEENGRFERNPEWYFFSVFGTPSPRGAWGWRVEGHHLSLHFTVIDGTVVASAPSFFGTNPAEVRDGPKKGLRILGVEEDSARALLMALDETQRATAIIDDAAPRDIATENAAKVDPLAPAGVRASAMTPHQRDLLMRLIAVYTSMMATDLASERTAKLQQAGVENIAFAWAGEVERGKPHYYRVQGPTFLVEYDNTQNDGNHVHSVWRDFDGDFGRDLLREHRQAYLH